MRTSTFACPENSGSGRRDTKITWHAFHNNPVSDVLNMVPFLRTLTNPHSTLGHTRIDHRFLACGPSQMGQRACARPALASLKQEDGRGSQTREVPTVQRRCGPSSTMAL